MKKIFFVFAAAALFGSFLVSCGGEAAKNGAKQADDQNLPADAGTNEEGEQAATEKLKPDVPDDKDYGGYEFAILANDKSWSGHWFSRDIYVEGETGDTIDDAVYYRNRAIEEKYNVAIKGAFSANQLNDAKKSIKAADDSYDVLSIPMQWVTSVLAQEGMLVDLKHVPYIDLEKPWWDQRANRQLSIGNKLLFTISDLLVIDKDALFIFLFSKDVIQEHDLDDPYQLVRDGKWTVDKMWEMGKLVTQDLNGDGKMDDADKYGLITQTHCIHGNVVGAGHFVITKDENDIPILNIEDPVILDSYSKWIDIINDRANAIVAQDWFSKYTGETIWDQQLDMLTEKRGLWLYTGMNRVTMLREAECNFGILPNPKHNESQKEYYNAVYAGCTTAISIPVTSSEIERTGIVLEALTAESYYTLRPAYYDISLKSKLMRDDESGEMLDLIFSTRCYDLGQVYNWGGIFTMFETEALKKNTDFVSAYEKIVSKAEKEMQKALDNFADLD